MGCALTTDVGWPEINRNGEHLKVTWDGPDEKRFFIQTFCNGEPISAAQRVDVKEYSFHMRPGNYYWFEVHLAGFEKCNCHWKKSKMVFSNPPKPTGVELNFCNGLNIEWHRSDENVAHYVNVYHDNDILQEFRNMTDECRARVPYGVLLRRPLCTPFKVCIWAEDIMRGKGENHVEECYFDGTMNISFFVVMKDDDIIGCFVSGGGKKAEEMRDNLLQEGFEMQHRGIIKTARLRWPDIYDADLEHCDVDRNRAPKVFPRTQKINTKDLVDNGSAKLCFAIHTRQKKHFLDLRIKSRQQTIASFPTTWVRPGSCDRDEGYADSSDSGNESDSHASSVRFQTQGPSPNAASRQRKAPQVKIKISNKAGDVDCNKGQTRIAQNMADTGGQMTLNQPGGTNTQNAGKQ